MINIYGKINKDYFFLFITFIVLAVALNSDWMALPFVWWGCLCLFTSVFFICGNGKFKYEKKYTLWTGAFFFLCAASIIWAASRVEVTNILKNMLINTAILFMLRSYMLYKEDVLKIIKLFIAAITLNAFYLLYVNRKFLTVANVSATAANRLGSEGLWNANAIGMMMSIGFIYYIYRFRRESKNVYRIGDIFFIAILGFAALVSGSRKALVSIVLGTVIYLLLDSEGKRARSILIIIAVIVGVYYAVVKIPYFYSIIGWRMETMISGYTGVGDVDHSTILRKQFIEVGLRVFKEHPILGVGIDCFRVYNSQITGYRWYAHNNYVELLADLGIIGFIVYHSGYIYLLFEFIKKIHDKDSITKMLFSIFVCIMVSAYGAVIYSDFLFPAMIMIMFAWFTTKWKEV